MLCIYSDTAPWLSDLQQVADMARSQYTELKGVCQHLKQQNEALKRLVKQLVSAKGDNTTCDLGMFFFQVEGRFCICHMFCCYTHTHARTHTCRPVDGTSMNEECEAVKTTL